MADFRRNSAAAQYGIALCSAAAGLGLRFALNAVLHSTVPYITYFPGVMFAAWFGGLGPGILTTILALLGVLYFEIPPQHHFIPIAPEDSAGAIVFVGVSIFICILTEGLRRSRARSDQQLQELTLETARRGRVEAALAESRRDAERGRDLLQTTLSSIGDAVIATDTEGRVTFLNTIAQDLTGWSQSEAAGRQIEEVFVIRNEKTGEKLESPVARAMREGKVVGLANHTVLAHRDGREIPIEDSAAPIQGQDHRVLGAVLVFRDATSRRRYENALERSEERLRLALDAGQIGVWDWNVSRNRIEWSDLLYDIHGVERGRFGGTIEDFARLMHPEDRERITTAIQAALQGEIRYQVEFRVVHPDGNTHWVSTTAMVIRDERGAAVRMLGATTDVTGRKRSEAAIDSLIKRLRRSNEDLDQFAHAASHDLRSPLRTISTMVELLADGQKERFGGEEAELINLITASAKRMDTLISDLLEFSTLTQASEDAEVEMGKCLEDALTNLRQAQEECGAQIEAGPLPKVRAHHTHLVRVFQNLVANAIKYRGPETPRVHIAAELRGTAWIVRVKDNGIGFEAQYAEQVFAAFKRLHGHEYPGSGIGLASCKRIVERYGGRIWAESEPGKGSTFSFSLPATRAGLIARSGE